MAGRDARLRPSQKNGAEAVPKQHYDEGREKRTHEMALLHQGDGAFVVGPLGIVMNEVVKFGDKRQKPRADPDAEHQASNPSGRGPERAPGFQSELHILW